MKLKSPFETILEHEAIIFFHFFIFISSTWQLNLVNYTYLLLLN